MSQEITTVINETKPVFAKLLGLSYRTYSQDEVMAMVEQQLTFFHERAMFTPSLLECTPQSVILGIRKALTYNLSLDKSADQIYMIPQSVKQGDKWVKVLDCPLTVNGELSVSYQCGTIIDHKLPTVKYDAKNRVESVTVHIRKPTGEWEDTVYDNQFFKRLMSASHTKNGRNKQDADPTKLNYANEKYREFNGWIDPVFASTKALKHRLKKLGNNMNAKRGGEIRVFEPMPSEPIEEIIVESQTDLPI